MGAFFRILLVAILIFYVFNMIIKMMFRRKMNKLQQQMEQFSQGEAKSPTEETQKVHVDPNIGEYTDFEEIE
jgi:flagellar biosynthesis/type III secretory pathway M-ring protein FliF/YscJ